MFNQIMDKVENAESIAIYRHVLPDADALGSQTAIKELLTSLYPEKTIITVGNESFAPFPDMDTSFVEKADVTLVLDTANIERIDGLVETKHKTLIKIDHHPPRQTFGDIEWVDTTFSSTCEMITEFINEFFPEQLTTSIAEKLYLGIVGDTGRFLFDNVQSKTHRMAAKLHETDIQPNKLLDDYYERSPEQAAMEGYILSNFQTHHRVGYAVIPQETLKQYQLNVPEVKIMANLLKNIRGVDVWCLFIETPEGAYKGSVRSKETPINQVAETFNGGGHPLASGIMVQHEQIKEVIKHLSEIIE